LYKRPVDRCQACARRPADASFLLGTGWLETSDREESELSAPLPRRIRKGVWLVDEIIDLESARLVIREVAPDDLPLLLPVYLSNPEYVAQREGSRGEAGYFDLEMFQRDWQIAQMTPGRHMLGVYLKKTREAVGLVDYLEESPEDSQPWLGFLMIARAHQRQGLGTEAFECLAAYFNQHYDWPSLRVSVMETNVAVVAFWRRLGFVDAPMAKEPVDQHVTLQRQP
jgi:RimJ/RimL family protein N-acetyltransferase